MAEQIELEGASKTTNAVPMGTVQIMQVDNTIRLVFDVDEDDIVDFFVTDKLVDLPEIVDLRNKKGSKPRAKTVRALLTCNEGLLNYDGQLFHVSVPRTTDSTLGDSGRVSARNLPSPDISGPLPEVADSPAKNDWKLYEKEVDRGDTLFRYVRHGLAACGLVQLSDVNQVLVSYVDLGDTVQSLRHVDHRSTACSALILNISGVSADLDGQYRIKLIVHEAKYRHEVYANKILMENTNHGAFLTCTFAFRCRLTNDGPNQYALAVRLVNAINLRQATNAAEISKLGITEIEILRGLRFMAKGRMTVDTRVEPRADGSRIQWSHGDHHQGNILVWRDADSNGFRRFAYIDFANSDIVYTASGLTQRLFGGPLRDAGNPSTTLLTPSGVTEAQELVSMFVQLLRAGRYDQSAAFLSRLGLACTLPAAYNAAVARLNQLNHCEP